ncbi:MAG: hydroxyacid dehydrogenase [Candidatus Brachytrichaceae bacterium NZ_4S206]|jgi:D-3-phosphoglycerate dehydrogenase
MPILITEWMPVGVDRLEAFSATTYDSALWRDRARLFDLLSECEALIVRNQTQVDAELLDHAPKLKVVGRLGVGLDNLDLNALRERGITVVTGGNANAVAVAEYTIAAMLALARKLPAADRSTKGGAWDRATFGAGVELYGKTLGLIGLGDIGARVAKRADAFGMRVIAYDPLITPTHFAATEFGVTLLPLDDVLRESDFVSLHVPLLPTTANLINAERLARMKPTAILINTSRGRIVDESALAQALQEKRLGGAALDVRAHEPPGEADPLAQFENVLLTPHIAGLTAESQARVCTAVAEDVLRVLRGEKPVFATK